MNLRARRLGKDVNVHVEDDGQIFPTEPAFVHETPGRFPRPFDRADDRRP